MLKAVLTGFLVLVVIVTGRLIFNGDAISVTMILKMLANDAAVVMMLLFALSMTGQFKTT